ncbi:MAG: protein kinase [Solirubrobacterales bacterium]|nr:protein kinase [Solirubrobacterales bacterium]
MEPFRDDNELAVDLRALRPEPRQEFATELDERAAAGFPRSSSRGSSPLGSLLSRLRTLPPRRLALSAATLALAAIALATAVIAVKEPRTDSASLAQLNPSELPSRPGQQTHPTGAGAGGVNSLSQASRPNSGNPHSGEESSGIQYETAVPATTGKTAASSQEPSSASAGATSASGSSPVPTGPFASKAGHRNVERSAEIVLGADPSEVGSDAAQVFDAVHAVDGIVLSSSVSGGAAGDAGARFDLLIPSAKLGDALAAFSAIDVVVSRHEATDDITAPTVRVGEHLRDSRATIDGLLVQLAGADTDQERAEVEAELRGERRHAAALRSQATKLDRRANLSRVSLRIETGAAATSSGESGSWGIGDALGDAGHILAIAAGVTIVGLAILAPLALIALLAWLANRARLRHARQRALS